MKKKIKFYKLEGCATCTMVLNRLVQFRDDIDEVSIDGHTCGEVDSECDKLEDTINTSKYPITVMTDFPYIKDKFHKVNGIVYFSNNIKESTMNISISDDSVTIPVMNSDEMINKLEEIIKY